MPFGLLFLSRWGGMALRLMRLVPRRLTGGRAWNELNFVAGHQLLQLNRPEAAWEHLEQCLRYGDEPEHCFLGAVCLYHGLGRFADSQALLRRANDIRERWAREQGVADFPGRVLDQIWTAHIGHTATLDYVVKLTKDATKCWKDDIEGLRKAGFDDRGILQITLIASWFNYINRVADSLGVGRE